jgi:hypothetical protein
MAAHYDDHYGTFEVEFGEERKGFILDFSREYDYELQPERHEAVVPSLSRYERDRFLDECYSSFGPLDHFVRGKEQNRSLHATTAAPSG